MEKIIIPFVSSDDPIVVCGDLNIDLLKQNCYDYIFLLESLNLKNVLSSPTRITSQGESLIDHILCNSKLNASAGVFDVAIADHNPTFIFLPRKCLSPIRNAWVEDQLV